MPRMRGPQLLRSIKSLSASTSSFLISGTWSGAIEGGVAFHPKAIYVSETTRDGA